MEADLVNFFGLHAPEFETILGKETWYIVVLSALTTGRCYSSAAGAIYKFLIKRPDYSSQPERQALVRRLRETLVKLVAITGIPKCLESMLSLAAVVDEQDNDRTFTREGWTPMQTFLRGREYNDRIYQGDADQAFQLLEPHKDFTFIVVDIVYGLFLSDNAILSNIEAEAVVLSSLIIQGTQLEVSGHRKGLLRQGMNPATVEGVISTVQSVAKFMANSVPDLHPTA